MQVLVVNTNQASVPQDIPDLIQQRGWTLSQAHSYESALDEARDSSPDAVILAEPAESTFDLIDRAAYTSLIRLIETRRLLALMFSDKQDSVAESNGRQPTIERIPTSTSFDELRGRLAMVDRYHSHFVQLEREIQNMERLGKRLNEHFREVDQEMRLAARLQRDFLPKLTEPIRNLQFATVYRPASWVSGDLFDAFRIDEKHTGFYIADAVGHGMAASLLTIFIERSVVPKVVNSDGYTICTPSQVLGRLNDSIADQALPNCQFVTAWYGLFNHETSVLTYARGGHPYPVLISKDGTTSELKAPGGLLGLMPDDDFPTSEIRLEHGDKLLLFTDGVELAFQKPDRPLNPNAYLDTFQCHADLPIQDMVAKFEASLDHETGSLKPKDDVTIVGIELLPSVAEELPTG